MKRLLSVVMAVIVFATGVNVTGLKVQAEEQGAEKRSIRECRFVESLGVYGTIQLLPSQKYTGNEINPSVTIKDGDYTLVEDTDYWVSYTDNVIDNVNPCANAFLGDEPCPGMIVYGMGKYTGIQALCFAILSDTQKETADHLIYSGKAVVSGYDGVTIDGYAGTEAEVTIPDYIDGKPVQEINDYAFAYNPVLTKVNISDNVVAIGEDAFIDCVSLTDVKVSKQLWTIDSVAFAGCTSLKEIYLPDTVRAIGLGIFDKCTAMEAVHVQAEQVYDIDGVLFTTELGTNDLYFYPPAKELETYCIPDGTEELGIDAFRDVGSVKNIIIPESVKAVYGGQHGAFFEMTGAVNIVYKHNKPTDRILGKSTFYNLPAGSAVTVKNEEMKAAAEAAISSNCAGNVTVKIELKHSNGFILEQNDFTLSKGAAAQLQWTQTPADTTDSITWKSSDEAIAKVDPVLGRITAVNYGRCTITGMDETGHSQKADVLVYDPCTSHSFELYYSSNKKECTLVLDEQNWEYATAMADGYAGAMPIEFIVEDMADSNPETVAVKPSRNNPNMIVIEPQKPGTATITAIFDDNGTEIRESIVIHVKDNAALDPGNPDPNPVNPDPPAQKQTQTLKYTKSYQKIYGSKAFQLNVKRTKGNGKLSYTSSNEKVAAVDGKGRVTIKDTGRTVITVTAAETKQYQKKSVKIIVDVKPKKAAISSVKAVKGRKIQIEWKKDSKASGYQLQYAADRKFKKQVKTIDVKKNKTSTRTITKLKKGKTYYVRVRSYKNVKVNGKTKKLAGSWSSVKKSGKIK